MRTASKLNELAILDIEVIHMHYYPHNRKLRRIKSENAEEEKQIKIDLDETKLNYAHALKRNMAIKAMLSMLNVSCILSFDLCNAGRSNC